VESPVARVRTFSGTGGHDQVITICTSTFPCYYPNVPSNCIVEPLPKYKQRMFTFGPVGWSNVAHLGDDPASIDWSPVVACAQDAPGFGVQETGFSYAATSREGQPSPKHSLMVGFGHETVLGAASTVIDAIKSGAISRFFLIGGCDGSEENRSYFTELAAAVPHDAVILTLGCGKFRIDDTTRQCLGNIGDTGIPRVLDVGQCNDAYGAVQIALALAKALDCEVADLPISIVLSWLEQKAVAVLLTCLHLGLSPVRIGPTLPAFVTDDVLSILVRDFGVRECGDPKQDLQQMVSATGMRERQEV